MLCHEYGWSLHYVFFELPFAMAQHLYSAIGERKGQETGSGYVDRQVAKAVAEMKQYLEQNYTIT